jgi:catechol 2,3-dioxygenase-like lactoylglutathione lyase family enzyme
MEMKLEVVLVPVSDVDRAKTFYEKLGFRLDIDYSANNGRRVVQFTPPGSERRFISETELRWRRRAHFKTSTSLFPISNRRALI